MFNKVLIATDSSPSSLAVIGCAKSLRLLGARECVLAQCFSIREHVAFPDQIKAYITKDRGAAVHKTDCKNMLKIQKKWPQKIIEASWKTKVKF